MQPQVRVLPSLDASFGNPLFLSGLAAKMSLPLAAHSEAVKCIFLNHMVGGRGLEPRTSCL